MVGIITWSWIWRKWYIIGSSAGIVATGLAEINGHRITFNQFLRVGFPFMIASVAVGSIVLLIDMH